MELSCIIIDDEEHAISEAQDLVEITPGLKLTSSFRNVTDAINFLREFGEVDIIFSDISMPNIDGIEAGKILNAYCSFLIYISRHQHNHDRHRNKQREVRMERRPDDHEDDRERRRDQSERGTTR